MSTQDTVSPLTALTPPRTLNTYKDRRRQDEQKQPKKTPAPKGRRHPGSKHIDEYA